VPVKVLSAPSWRETTGTLDQLLAAAQARSPLDPVTVVTPTARSAVGLRRELVRRRAAAGGPQALANARFMVLTRLAGFLGGPALEAVGRRRGTRADVGAALSVECQHAPPWLREALAHPAGEAELVERYEELRGASSGALSRLALGDRRSRELAALLGAVRARLAPRCYDDVDLFESASAAARRGLAATFGSVIVHLPERLRPAEVELLLALGEGGELTVVADPERSELGALRTLPSPEPAGAALSDPVEFSALLAAPDPATEVREAVRLVLGRLERGLEPERVALVHSHASPYAPLLAAALATAAIPFSGRAPLPLDAAPSARFLARLFALSRRSLSRPGLFALLESAPLDEAQVGPAARAEWDRCSRLAGVTGGDLSHWFSKLLSLRDAARRSLAEAGGRGGGALGRARAERSLAALRTFLPWLRALDEQLAALERARRWSTLAAACGAALDALLGPAEVRAAWPGWAGDADALVLGVLDELALLDDIDDRPTGAAAFGERLAMACVRPGPHVGTLGSGVAVGALEQSVGLDLDLLVVLGASDKELPTGPPTSPLLSAGDRARVGLEVPGAAGSATLHRRRLLLARAGAREAVASYATATATGGQRGPSPLIAGPARRLGRHLASLGALARGEGAALDEAEWCAAALSSRGGGRGDPDGTALALGGAVLGRALAFLRDERRPARPLVAGTASLVSPVPFSPTSLQEYATCPARYLLGHVLSLEVVEDPALRLFVDPRDRGSIVHEVLERFVGTLMAGGAGDEGEEEARLRAIAEEVFGRYERLGRTGKSVLWELEKRRLLRILEAERRADLGRRSAGVLPIALEHAFGFGGSEPVRVAVAAGQLEFRGLIDRVDRTPAGVQVVDYKTGRPDEFRAIAGDPVDRGRHLQLMVYALAARASFGDGALPVRAAYRFLGPVPEEVGLELDENKVERFAEATEVLVSSINSGRFPVRPGEAAFDGFSNCRFCDFDALCPADRAERWESARRAPALDAFRSLVEEPYLAPEAPPVLVST